MKTIMFCTFAIMFWATIILVQGCNTFEMAAASEGLRAYSEADRGGRKKPSTVVGDVIESHIDGTFKGWDGDTIFKLTNGQIWQQSAYAYTYYYAYRPKVTIYRSIGSTIVATNPRKLFVVRCWGVVL